MRLSRFLVPLSGGLVLYSCLFVPVDGYVEDETPTYPDGGHISTADGGGVIGENGVLANVGISGTITNGGTYASGLTLSATATPYDAQGVAVGNVTYQWGLTSNAATFISGANGVEAQIQTQTVSQDTQVTLTVQVTQNGRTASTGITFTVQAAQNNVITEIRIGGAPETLIVGQSVQDLYVQGFNSQGAVVQTITSLDSWISSNTNIVGVQATDAAHARVTGVGAGTATIQAVVGSFTSPAITIVSKQPYISLTQQCSPSSTQTISAGGNLTLYSMTYNGSTCEVFNAVWQSSNTNAATVSVAQSTSTVVHGVANGQTSITATFSGVIVSLSVNVGNVTNANQHIVRVVTSSPQCGDAASNQATVAPNTQFYVAAVNGDAVRCSYSQNYFFTWATQNGEVATVQPAMDGQNFATVTVPAGATGKTNITVTGTGDGGSFYAEFEVIIGAT